MKSLFALFMAGCTFMVVAAGALWAWQVGSPFVLGIGRLDGAEPPAEFVVVVHEPGSGGYRYLYWDSLPGIDVDGDALTFLLPASEGADGEALSPAAALPDHREPRRRSDRRGRLPRHHSVVVALRGVSRPHRPDCVPHRRRPAVQGDDRVRGGDLRRVGREVDVLVRGEPYRSARGHGVMPVPCGGDVRSVLSQSRLILRPTCPAATLAIDTSRFAWRRKDERMESFMGRRPDPGRPPPVAPVPPLRLRRCPRRDG